MSWIGVGVTVGSFLFIFGSVLTLFRFEYEVPTVLSTVISLSVVLMGFLVVLATQAAGIAAPHETAGGLAGILFVLAVAVAVLG